MTQEIINIGAVANDGEGDPLRVAFAKINNNFTQLYQAGYFTTIAYTFDDTSNQVIFETPVGLFTEASFQINSSNPETNDSQNITLNAAISNDGTSVKFSSFGTTIINDYVVNGYDMDVVDGNVRVLVDSVVNSQLIHFIAARVNFIDNVPGSPIGTESDIALATENSYIITTEQPA